MRHGSRVWPDSHQGYRTKISSKRDSHSTVIPAQAGIQEAQTLSHSALLDSRLRGNDGACFPLPTVLQGFLMRYPAAVAKAFGFELSRVRGSHHIFEHPDVPDILNLQDCGGQAKPYQVEQFLALVEQYNLGMQESDA